MLHGNLSCLLFLRRHKCWLTHREGTWSSPCDVTNGPRIGGSSGSIVSVPSGLELVALTNPKKVAIDGLKEEHV